MTHLDRAAEAVVDEAKVRRYLLAADHPQNGGKAAYFAALGFSDDAWIGLQSALVRHSPENPVIQSIASVHGEKHVVHCTLRSPDGRNPCITTVWIVEGERPPRLVTAYP
jgi:hypothetical protein